MSQSGWSLYHTYICLLLAWEHTDGCIKGTLGMLQEKQGILQ
jgi:hypothetical protein